jgi:PKD repeat protein
MARREFLERAAGAVRRARRAAWLRRSQTAAFFAFSILVTLLLIDRIAYEAGWLDGYLATPAATAWSLGALAVLVVAACRWGGRLPTEAQALAEVDRRAGTAELFSTAFEVPSDSAFAEPLLRQAAAKLRTLDLQRAIPWPVTAYLAYAVPILLMGGVLIAFPGETLYPPLAALEASPEEGPAPLRVELRSLSSGHISHFEWDLGDGVPRRDESLSHVFDRAGIYRVSLVARGPRGSDRAEREIRVLPPGTVVAAFRLRPVKGYAPLEVRAENLSRNAASFRWEFGDGATSTVRAPTHRFERPGRYQVRLFAEGAERPAEAEVEAYAPDQPLAEFRADPVEGEAPLAVRFENRSMGAIESYEWDLGDPYAGGRSKSVEEHPSFVYAVPGVYTVTLKVRGANGADVEEKKHYIRVTRRGGGGGGSGGAAGGRSREGPDMGEPPERPKVEFDPKTVNPIAREGPLVEKTRTVHTESGEGGDPEQRYRDVFPEYRRQAEESIERERIPSSARDLIRRYFEGIRPR